MFTGGWPWLFILLAVVLVLLGPGRIGAVTAAARRAVAQLWRRDGRTATPPDERDVATRRSNRL